MFAVFAIAAVCLSPPVNGDVTRHYSPAGQYSGHWGVDYEASVGEPVRAPASGVVTFAGSVAGMKTLTIEPLEGFKVSVSYLQTIQTHTGARVERGDVVGTAGAPHGVPGVHMSTRINGRYVNPTAWLGCARTDITRALRLLPPPQPYPRRRAHRNTRRDIRPDSRGPSPRSRMRTRPVRPRQGATRSRWQPMAEVRQGSE